MSEQIPLFCDFEPNGRKPTRDELGLRPTPAGAERLLSALLTQGLAKEHLPAAAQLCLLLDSRDA